ncbi:MAG: glycoside hydrolase family 2 [Clostridia bacterium]|nr:glycoside hydrolase family 2 [Clostridia bacterium]
MNYFRNEYPRPQFKRQEWLSLNGEWEFCFDDKNEGLKNGYATGKKRLPLKIIVPFAYQYSASQINDYSYHSIVWYKRTFKTERKSGKRALLCFNGCDYLTDVWVNGNHVIQHKGGYAPFNADITDYIYKNGADNTIVIRCYDPLDSSIPRGKQSWTGERFGCWYIPSSGIWQSVWIDYFGEDGISSYSIVPDVDNCSFFGEIKTFRAVANECEITLSYKGEQIKKVRFNLDGKYTRYSIDIKEYPMVQKNCLWWPHNPNLFDFEFALYSDGKRVDYAISRAGLRKISIDENGKILLNNKPLYQRLILDQGYWEETGITPPSVDAIRKDIQLCKDMGFNGARKHQKIEDPYFYYLADEMGYLTWCEMPSAYTFNDDEIMAITEEWQEILHTVRNFTSIICYVPLNESWGVDKILINRSMQDFARSLYYLTKSIDPNKLISTNDGWENLDLTDIISIHDYAYDSNSFNSEYNEENYNKVYPQGKKLLCEGCYYRGQPVLLTEFGGIALAKDSQNGNWGYNNGAKSEEEFLERYANLIEGIYNHKDFQGFCYTQVSDVQQEVNGLLYADRTPKFNLQKIKKITVNEK